MGLIWLLVACTGGLWGILSGLTKSTDHPSIVHGWLPKLWSPYGSHKYSVQYSIKDPKRDHNFDNHPHAWALKGLPYHNFGVYVYTIKLHGFLDPPMYLYSGPYGLY